MLVNSNMSGYNVVPAPVLSRSPQFETIKITGTRVGERGNEIKVWNFNICGKSDLVQKFHHSEQA